MKNTFKGGIWPVDHKYTLKNSIENVSDPHILTYALYQYDNVTALPVVKPGTYVYEGQLIAEIPQGRGVPLHASVSGTVTKIEPYFVGETKSYKIIIENDHQHLLSSALRPFGKKLSESSLDEIVSVIRSAGIVDEYGPKMPVYARIKTARTYADKLIINFTEPEPFVTSRHHMILNHIHDIVGGAKILLMALGVREATFAVEKIRKNELKALNGAISGAGFFSVSEVTSKYPVNFEKQLVSAVTGVNLGKKRAIDAGYAIFSAEVCYAIYQAFSKGMPSIRKYVTLDGDCVEEPRILSVPIGTPISHIVSSVGGFTSKPSRIVIGGPLTGRAIENADEIVEKMTDAVLVLGKFFDSMEISYNCIHCGQCAKACPQGLSPYRIAELVLKSKTDEAREYLLADCIGCSCCSYVCPCNMPLTALVESLQEVQND